MPVPFLRLMTAVCAVLLSLASCAASLTALPLNAALNEQVQMIPVEQDGALTLLQTTLFKPPGDGPFPLLLMNHGKSLGDPHQQSRDRFVAISREFVRRGYAVAIPMRTGFAGSGGQYREAACDMARNGQIQASDVRATLDYLRRQPWVDATRILIGGQSYGGLATLAIGTQASSGVRGLLNFAGGLRMHGGQCDWQRSLVQAFAQFGRHTKVPSLWFYGANDRHFAPPLVQRLVDAYLGAGGPAQVVRYGIFRSDAHGMSATSEGVAIWWPATEKFLQQIDMPTAVTWTLPDDIALPASGYATLEDVAAVPFLNGGGREAYRQFLVNPSPRAFALAPSGDWSWAAEGEEPMGQALLNCGQRAHQRCVLYAVNEVVVWPEPIQHKTLRTDGSVGK